MVFEMAHTTGLGRLAHFPMVRRAPLVDDRLDLDEFVLEGEPSRRLFTPRSRVAVDGNRERIKHPGSVRAREGTGVKPIPS